MTFALSATGAAVRLQGPLLFLRRVVEVGLKEAVLVEGVDGRQRAGRIAAIDEDFMTIEMLESTVGLDLPHTRVIFSGKPLTFAVSTQLLGRVFNGIGQPLDGGPALAAEAELPIDGLPMNPLRRATPRDFIETGISSIDILNSLVRGQKLPIFSGGGLPHDELAAAVAQYARLRQADAPFALVFAAIGISYDSAEFFRQKLANSGALARSVLFLNLASDSSTQRLLTPRFALTAAEYLAFEKNMHVLVILTDLTNYCEALREVSSSLGEIPSRKGYPGYMYSDLATLYERAGRLHGREGTLTQLPILTMPADDITHPIPDLTGYITEGQIVLDRDLHRRSFFPPVKALTSLSRLMKDGTGKHYTHPDHPALASQLYAAYARAQELRVLAGVVGSEGLAASDQAFLTFAEAFESDFIAQTGRRSLEDSMTLAWRLLAQLPPAALTRLSDAQIKTYIANSGSGAPAL